MFSIVCTLATGALHSQLVVDLQRNASENWSSPGAGHRLFVEHGSHLYFPASTLRGAELYRMPLSGAAAMPSRASNLQALDANRQIVGLSVLDATRLLVIARRPASKLGLYTSRGTIGSERFVADLEGDFGPDPFVFARLSGPDRALIGSRKGLWVTDGSAAGTRQLDSSWIHWLLADPTSGRVFGVSILPTAVEFWSSDGSASGKRTLRMFDGTPRDAVRVGSRIVFRGYNRVSGKELWSTDGTAAGTARVLDLAPGAAHGVGDGGVLYRGRYWFLGSDGRSEPQLYSSDGTSAGTRREAVLRPNWSSEGVFSFQALQGRIWIQTSKTLFSYDSSTKQLDAVSTPSIAKLFEGRNGRVDLVIEQHGIWSTDGKALRFESSVPPYFVSVARRGLGSYVFNGSEPPVHDRELWVADAGQARAWEIADLFPGQRTANAQIDTTCAVSLGDELFFERASLGEVWSTTGEAATTRMSFSGSLGEGAVRIGDRLLFMISPNVLTSRGTSGSTTLLSLRPGDTGAFVGRGGGPALVDVKSKTSALRTLYFSDGSAAGTRFLAQVQTRVWDRADIAGSSEFLIMTANSLLRSDGTWSGTRELLRLQCAGSRLARCAHGHVFQATDAQGDELWVTDGSASGTHRLVDIRAGAASSEPRHFVSVGRYVYFGADDGAAGRELWRTDGSVGGTRRVFDYYPGALGSDPEPALQIGADSFVFAAYDPKWGRELFESDGTTAGTRLLADIHPGHDSFPIVLGRVGDALIVVADDGVHGRELHRVSVGASAWKDTRGCFDEREASLEASRPRLGGTQVLRSDAFSPGAPRALLAGVPRGTQTTQVVGCEAAWNVFGPIWVADAWAQTSAARRTSIQIAQDVKLLGVRYALQTVTLAPTLPGGIALSHGVECVIGR